jgi:phage shock protein C
MERKLYRSRKNRVLLGVCGGLAEYFNIDPVIIRVIAVLLLIPGVFPAILAYFILALVVPLEGSTAATPRDNLKENITDVKTTATGLGEDVRTTFESKSTRGTSTKSSSSNSVLYILGIVIVVIGVFILLTNVFDWFWRFFWPVLLIVAGAIVILLVARKRR